MMPGLAQSAQLCQHHQCREYVAPNEKNQVMQSMIGTVEHPLSGLRYAELTSPVRREDVSKGVNKGLTIKKKLPIKKRHSAGAGTNISLDSESCSNSRLEVASTVSSSDLESAQSNAADSPFQPLVGQRNVQLQPIRTTAAIAGISAQVLQDERAPQGYVGKHSASIQTVQETASTAHATPWQVSEEDPSPRKLEIRRSGMSTPTRAQQQVQHAPTRIIEEPCESLARLSIHKSQHEVASFAANQYMGCSTPPKMRHASKSPQHSQKMDAQEMEQIDYNYAYGCHGYESDADMSETFHLSASSQYTMQAPMSPRTLSGSASPQKLAIRRTNQVPDHRGGYFQHSHDQHGFLSPRHMQRQLMTQQADVSATFTQHDAEYMHAYQAECMRQHRRASMGAPIHHQMPDACLGMSTAHLQRWDQYHAQPQQRFQGLAVRRAARPDKNKLPSAEELNLPGWF